MSRKSLDCLSLFLWFVYEPSVILRLRSSSNYSLVLKTPLFLIDLHWRPFHRRF